MSFCNERECNVNTIPVKMIAYQVGGDTIGVEGSKVGVLERELR
jgi:hypothetical protein